MCERSVSSRLGLGEREAVTSGNPSDVRSNFSLQFCTLCVDAGHVRIRADNRKEGETGGCESGVTGG